MIVSLGAAQFGSSYGVSNIKGKVCETEIRKILELANEFKIDLIDTAPTYGDSEKILGKIGIKNFKIISKLPSIINSRISPKEFIRKTVENSLLRLDINSLEAILIHNPNDLKSEYGKEIFSYLLEIKKKGIVKKIGVSIYDPHDAINLLNDFDFEIFQIPFSIFDQRLFQSGVLDLLKKKNIEVHVRSIFLQGLLLMKNEKRPGYFKKWQKYFDEFFEWLFINNLTPLEACIKFIQHYDNIDRVIIGIENDAQLLELNKVIHKKSSFKVPFSGVTEEKLINPSKWKL